MEQENEELLNFSINKFTLRWLSQTIESSGESSQETD